jgi:type IV secretion system protein TrbL
MPFDPFGLLGSTAAHIVADGLTAAMLSLWNAGLWLLRVVLSLEDAVLTPNLAESGPLGELYRTTFWIAGALVGIFMLVQLGLSLGRRDGRTLGRLLVGVAQFGFVWFAWIGYGVVLVAACSGLTTALMERLLNVTKWSDWNPWQPFTVNDVTNGTVAFVLGLMGLLLWLAAIGHALVLLARAGALLVLAATTPISAAGLVVDFGRGWFWKSLRWFHAAALTPPLMVLCLGIGVQITSGVAVGAETDLLKSIGTAFIGVILICTSTFAPMALYKLFAFVDPGSTSGASLRAGLAAAGGIAGLLGGQKTSSSSASSTDDNGRTAGEDGAAATTNGRFGQSMAGLGPIGQAAATGLNAMAALGGAGSTLGYDLTNQMGAGHNIYPPDMGRRGVQAGNGEGGSSGAGQSGGGEGSDGQSWPSDATESLGASGPGSYKATPSGGGRPLPSFTPAASPRPSGGSGGGGAGAEGATAGEAAEVGEAAVLLL